LTPDDQNRSIPGAAGQPQLLADRYEVIEAIGSGATAITWRGRDRRLDRTVAIKILRREVEQDPAYLQRFEREARTSAAISHANVVNLYDVGQQDGWLYLVMQFIDGEDLKHAIDRRGRLPVPEALAIVRQILAGLGAIHRAGIIHRDIKPQNVLLDREGVAHVTDFGIAQAQVDSGLTTVGTTVGTAAYMAPEQAQAGALSEATDIYAVGVVLYEMLTGVLPFDKPTPMATMLAHIQEEPVAPSLRAPEARIPALLDGVVLQAMAKDPGDRFRSASAMARGLEGNRRETGATTPISVPPRAAERTRSAPAVSRPQPRPAPVRQPLPPPRQESGARGFLTALLVLLLLAMAAVAGWLYFEYTNRGDDNATETPVVTEQQVAPTDEPVETEPVIVIEPPTVDAEPTEEPAPTPTPEATEEPTEVPIEPADGQVIQPDSTPG